MFNLTSSSLRSDPSAIPHLLRAARRERSRRLSHLQWCREFLPHRFPGEPADFHRDIDTDLSTLHLTRGRRLAYLAPRDGAKSTVLTLSYALRCAVEGWEPYILLLSDSGDQAAKYLADLRGELEGNDYLRAVYPECGAGGEWRAGACRLGNGVLIEAMGRGSRVRGRRNRQYRPTLVIVDDPQGNRDIVSATERQRAWDWFTREVIPAGGGGLTNFLSVGTALHREAIAVKVGTLPGWSLRSCRAVHSWPEREDLWREWERKATNLTDENRVATAAAFYAANRAEMDRGAQTYWPSRWPVDALMLRRAEIGPSAFDTEYQQNPSSPVGAEWPAEYFDRPGFWFDDWPQHVLYRVQALDPSKGANEGDWQAHVVVALEQVTGTLYVDAAMHSETVPHMVNRAIDLAQSCGLGGPDALVVEDNDILGMFLPEIEQQLITRKRMVLVQGVRNTVNKVVRIRRIGSYLSRNRIRVRNTVGGRMLVDQMRDFPLGDHDDGPDALEMAIRFLEGLFK